MSLAEVIWDTPLILPMLLLPVRNQRMGGKGGPSFANRASTEARNRAWAFLEQHFTIVPKPLHEVGWQLGNEHLKL